MAKAPGYRARPGHNIREAQEQQVVRVVARDLTVAESRSTIRVEERGHPVRYYFPKRDVHTDLLERTDTTSRCPFKGTANYFTLAIAGHRFIDAVWTYEEPYDEHRDLQGLLAFYTEKFPELELRVG
ncbi:MAG TPA: DUF427 domain-containing protein [Polyangiaceae bacterium]|nr:DUF427 domain-containing protein [Polyangiaceae bacterium]